MPLFVILAPFAAFASLMMLTSATISLAVAALISLGIFVWDLAHGRSMKILSTGALVVFTTLLAFLVMSGTALGHTTVRLAVDGGLLVIALASLALRRPFTLQYAIECTDAETRAMPGFLRTNYTLTWVWCAAFVAMLLADIAAIYMPSMPLWTFAAIAFAARNGATYFTQWYPKRVRAIAADGRTAAAAI